MVTQYRSQLYLVEFAAAKVVVAANNGEEAIANGRRWFANEWIPSLSEEGGGPILPEDLDSTLEVVVPAREAKSLSGVVGLYLTPEQIEQPFPVRPRPGVAAGPKKAKKKAKKAAPKKRRGHPRTAEAIAKQKATMAAKKAADPLPPMLSDKALAHMEAKATPDQ